MNISKKTKRIKWLDFAKGITIFFVVFGHCIGGVAVSHMPLFKLLGYVIFTFIMPLFFAVSGFLYKPTNTIHKYLILLYKKICSFVIPYVVFTFVLVGIQNLSKLPNIILTNWLKLLVSPSGYLWFLYALFFIFIIVGLFDLAKVPYYIQLIIYFALMILSTYFTYTNYSMLPSNRFVSSINPRAGILGNLICFYLGYGIHKYHIYTFLHNKIIAIVLSISWVLSILIQYYFVPSCNTGSFSYTDIFTKLISIPVLFSIFVCFNQNNKVFRYFDKYGKYTLVIYLMHFPIMLFVGLHIPMIAQHVNPLCYFVVILMLSWGLSILLCNMTKWNKFIDFIFYPRKKYISKLIIKTTWGKKLLNK